MQKIRNSQNIPNLKGKIAIVTGANSGTGYGITYHLAKNNCKVIMASRNQSKLEEAKAQLLQDLPNAQVEIELIDLTSLESISQFTSRIKRKYKKIDFLANNAGGGSSSFQQTPEGLDSNLTINYLGHFALTTELLPVLKDGSRIVNFSSIGYKKFLKHDLNIDNLMCESSDDYNQMQEYCKAKLCSILHAVRLQKEFDRIGSTSKISTCHPGWARTNLMAQSGTLGSRVFRNIFNGLSYALGMSHSLYDGALPAIEALIVDDVQSDKVYSPSAKSEGTGLPIPRDIDDTHFVEEDIEKLWVKTQQILKIRVSDFLIESSPKKVKA